MSRSWYYAFVGTNSVRGSRGIYTIAIDADTGRAEVVSTVQAYNTGGIALSMDEKNLYVAAEGMTYDGLASGGVTAYRVEPDGSLKKLNGRNTFGQRTCCVAVDDRKSFVYTSDFYVGTWSAYPLEADGSLGPASVTVAPPEGCPRMSLHCVAALPDGYIGVISIAEGALVIYRGADGGRVTSFSFPEGGFPRYLAAADGMIYAMMQMPDDVYVFENHLQEDGTIRHIQTISVMDEAHRTMPATSTIRVSPDHSLVMAANRPSNSVTLYVPQPDHTLKLVRVADIHGNGPRDFNISRDGELVVVAMQHSDEVVILKVDHERNTLTQLGKPLHVPSPAAVAVTGRCREA